MGRKGKKFWFPPLFNKKKPGPDEVVTIDGDEEDYDTVMANEVSCNHELRDRLIAGIAKDVLDCLTNLVPDGNGGYTLEPSPILNETYPAQSLEQIKASLEVKLEYGIDMEPVPPQVQEENQEEATMMGIVKPTKRIKRSMWGPDAVFNCDQCEKSFKHREKLRRHRITHVNNPDKYICQVCNRKYPNSIALGNHRITHVNNLEKYVCQLCEKKFRNSRALRNHRITHVNNPEKYVCQTCEKKCRNSRALMNHRRIHSDAYTTGKEKRRQENDKNAPKRPLAAFFLWMTANRQQLKNKYQDLSATDFCKKAGEVWRDMNETDKGNGKKETDG